MKKMISILMLLGVTVSVFAGFDYRLDLLSFEPLHKEYLADKDGAALQFNYMDIYRGFPDHVFQDGASWDGWQWDPRRYDFSEDSRLKTKGTYAAQIKLGESLSILRNTFTFDHWLSPISFDFTFSGIIDILMEGEVADMMAYDGAYFYGLTMSIGDFLSIRTGLHHICTHYGDAIMKAIPSASHPGKADRNLSGTPVPISSERDDFNVTYKFVRMNGIVLGISIQPVECMRLYGEWTFVPKNISSLRPVIFQPSWTELENNRWDYPEEFKNSIVNFGVELSYPIFRKLGKTTIAYDCHMYEEGKIRFRHEDESYFTKDEDPVYEPDAPWSIDHGIVLNQELSDSVSIEIGWHSGRSPLHAFWYMENPQYFYIGARFNPDPTVTIYDSARNR